MNSRYIESHTVRESAASSFEQGTGRHTSATVFSFESAGLRRQVRINPKESLPCILLRYARFRRLSLISDSYSESHDPVSCIPVISDFLYNFVGISLIQTHFFVISVARTCQ